MKDSDYIKIFTGNPIIAHRIISDLKKEGINAVVKEQTESGLLIPVFGGSNSDYNEIYVHKDELNKATVIVENINSDLPE